MTPFIQPHQYNYVKNQLKLLLQTVYFVGDWRVYNATKNSVRDSIYERFGDATPEQQAIFDGVSDIRGKDEVNLFLERLKPYIIAFPKPTEAQVKKLFKKVKKLQVPEMDSIDWLQTSYFGWRDISSQSLFLVVQYGGELVGVECKYSSSQGSGGSICTICGKAGPSSDVGLVVAVTKAKEYRSVGTYMCLDIGMCNDNITRLDELHKFIARVQSR